MQLTRAAAFKVQQESTMQQPHIEETIDHTDGQQNTGNHKKPGAPDQGGADRFGGTRSGAENVEPTPAPDKDEAAS